MKSLARTPAIAALVWLLAVLWSSPQAAVGSQGRPLGSRQSKLPVVLSANVPFGIGVYGTVWLHVATDGRQISDIRRIGGSAELADAASVNLKSWRFAEHAPTDFDATFRYVEFPQLGCDGDANDAVELDLPSFVQVRSRGHRDYITHCDAPMTYLGDAPIVVRTVAGIVRCSNCPDRHPISGALIQIGQGVGPYAEGKSNGEGQFSLRRIEPGKYWIRVSVSDYGTAGGNVLVNPDAPSSAPLQFDIPKIWSSAPDPGEIVDRASLPSYPEVARSDGLEGDVRIRVTSDGTHVVDARAESGPAQLAKAALDNVNTWHVLSNSSRSFGVHFRYVLLLGDCKDQAPMISMRFPSEVEIRACRR
jgi:hypothetical protein